MARGVARLHPPDGPTEQPGFSTRAPDHVTIHEDATDVDLLAGMAEGGVRHIPVVDDHGVLDGIATHDYVVATVGEMTKDVATVIEWQSREYRPRVEA